MKVTNRIIGVEEEHGKHISNMWKIHMRTPPNKKKMSHEKEQNAAYIPFKLGQVHHVCLVQLRDWWLKNPLPGGPNE
jgi:hypothetical protein